MSTAVLRERPPENRLDERAERLGTPVRFGSDGAAYEGLSAAVRAVLHAIADGREPTACDLMRRLSIDREAVTAALLRLDAMGWLLCWVRHDVRDSRTVHWRLSDAAERCVAAMRRAGR